MQHWYDLTQAHLESDSIVTIGVFDGVHIGHQHLIRRLTEAARSANKLAVAITFYPHPDIVLRHLHGRYYLTTPQEKADLLGSLGIDVVITQSFDNAFRFTRANDFVDMMLRHLKLTSLWVGSDFALGYEREGDVTFLREQGQQKGFHVEVADLVADANMIVSSTAIRHAINNGEIEQAHEWLGRSFAVSGEIVHGEKRGRTIGFPTANVDVWPEQVIPANGVYAGWATLGQERFMAVTNVGVRPTFAGQGITVETHLLDFNRDIYGEHMQVTFEKRLRPEKRFNGIQELIAQIHTDVESGRIYLAAHPS